MRGDGLHRSQAAGLLEGKAGEFSAAVESFTAKDGLSDDVGRAVLQDREGNIWVGTNNGLDRFQRTNLVPVVLPFQSLHAVIAAGDAGETWIDDHASIVRVRGGRVERSHRIPNEAVDAYRDHAGAIWWLCRDTMYRYSAGNYTRIAFPPTFPQPYPGLDIRAPADGSGALWLAALRQGLFYWKNGKWQQPESPSEFARLTPRTAFTDWMGRAWFGYEGGTIILPGSRKDPESFSC